MKVYTIPEYQYHKTQFQGLYYCHYKGAGWSFVDAFPYGLEDCARIGNYYPTKESLLADLHRVGTEKG